MSKMIETMTKKTMALLLATAMAAAAQGVNLRFFTPGADYYADGTSVQAGEAYAVVWTRSGHEFAGLDLYGRAVDTNNNAVVFVQPIARVNEKGEGFCPRTTVVVGNTDQYANGNYHLVLLDTRAEDANGNFVATGNAKRINGWGFARKGRVSAGRRARTRRDEEASTGASLLGASLLGTSIEAVSADNVVTHTTNLPEGLEISNPKITGIEVKDDEVILTVTGGSELLNFNVASGETTACADVARATTAQQGKKTMTFTVPRTEGQCFFRIVRN